jgi:hygromycin-B 4-O-kinase
MSRYKTSVESAAFDSFMNEHFGPDVIDVKMIIDGERSQAGIVETANAKKVVRFSKHGDVGYQKDKFAYDHFRGPLIPIPEIEKIGVLPDGIFFAVSELAQGITLDQLPADELKATLPSIIATMEAIHETAPVGSGFGSIQLDGTGIASSWHDALDRSQVGDDDDEELDSILMFERDIYDRFRATIKEYYQYCPNEVRQLIHGDYGFNNTLAENGKITGVIDWDTMAYGDPLYDVAWQDFWSPAHIWSKEVNVFGAIKQHYIDNAGLPEHFEERIDCYKMIIGANCLSYFAKSANKDGYEYVQGELMKIEVKNNR